MRNVFVIAPFVMLAFGCGPSKEEKRQVAKDVYAENKEKIKAKQDLMHRTYSRVAKFTPEEGAKPFHLKDKPPIDISTYPKNAVLAINPKEVDNAFISVESLNGGFMILKQDSLADVRRRGELCVERFLNLRYLGVIQIKKLQEAELTGNNKYFQKGLTLEFTGGRATARVFAFDLTDGEYLGSIPLKAQSSKKIKFRGLEFQKSLDFNLRQQLKESAVTELQFWDEVERKEKK